MNSYYKMGRILSTLKHSHPIFIRGRWPNFPLLLGVRVSKVLRSKKCPCTWKTKQTQIFIAVGYKGANSGSLSHPWWNKSGDLVEYFSEGGVQCVYTRTGQVATVLISGTLCWHTRKSHILSGNKASTSCVRTACPKLSTNLEQFVEEFLTTLLILSDLSQGCSNKSNTVMI